jgi:hypothetical protein
VEELVGLGRMVDPSQSASGLELKTTWTPKQLSNKIKWSYGLCQLEPSNIEICPTTFRPYYYVKLDDSIVLLESETPKGGLNQAKPGLTVTWLVKAESMFGPISGLISGNELYLNFCIKYGYFPCKEDYLTYCYNRECVYGSKTTLPYQIVQFYKEFNHSYEPIRQIIAQTNMSSQDVIKLICESRTIEKRIQMESLVNINMSEE